tara:strand:- start:210 stop:410 length:201 start_codon:yes stop_codon:yes gene_type:complete
MKPWENKQPQQLPNVAQSLTKMVTDKLISDEKVFKHKFSLPINVATVMFSVYLLIKVIQGIMSFFN